MPFEALGGDIDDWLAFRFDLIDAKGCQIDAVMWDIGLSEDSYALWTGSELLPSVNQDGYNKWFAAGIDCVERLVEETHARGLEAIWNHRVCPIDCPMPFVACPHDSPLRENYLKKRHPEWVNECWWSQGLWNLASEGLREHKQKYLRELLSRYDFDGVSLDFARHTPCLPPGKEWENREHATTFVRETRDLLSEISHIRNKPLSLTVRVAETIAGCHLDGFEIEKWVENGLIDVLVLGGRTSSVAVEEFRALPGGDNVAIHPSFDGHHTNDGYYFPSLEYFRGVFSNFLHQGADGISIFNWTCAKPEAYDRLNLPGVMKSPSQMAALFECGELETMRGKPKTYAVERRGGYPWAGNYLYRNDDKPLPIDLAVNENAVVSIFIYEKTDDASEILLDVILFQGDIETSFTIEMNGVPLKILSTNPDWKDGQIYGDGPQATAGGVGAYGIDPEQRLLKSTFTLPSEAMLLGENVIDVRLSALNLPVRLEKLEVRVLR